MNQSSATSFSLHNLASDANDDDFLLLDFIKKHAKQIQHQRHSKSTQTNHLFVCVWTKSWYALKKKKRIIYSTSK